MRAIHSPYNKINELATTKGAKEAMPVLRQIVCAPKKAQFPAATASSVPFITAPPVFENRDIRAMGLSLTTTHSSSGQLVEKHIEGSNPTAPGNDEISPGDTIDLVDGRAPTRGIVFTEDVAKIEFTLISNDKRACIDWSRENLGAIKVQ